MFDLPPTQEIDNSMEISQKDSQQGSLFPSLLPLRPEFPTIEINKNEYTFGRAECDYIFSAAQFNEKVHYGTLSKVHFKIIREQNNQGFVTFLQDCSSNGTYVNESRVGKGKRIPLNNSDRISLSIKTFYCFIFSEVAKTSEYPLELSSKYTVTMTLGSGACGEVKLVYSKDNDKKFAMKIISKKNLPSWNDNYLDLPEVNILKQLRHPCIIKLHEVINSVTALYIILELVEGGELYDRLVKDKTSEHEARFLFLQMVLAIKYLHDKGISHRDLKPENILLTKKEGLCLVKITDFGLSKLVDGTSLLKTFCGTPTYLAPEILRSAGMGTYTHSVDVWSLGVILYICLVGYPPFTDDRKDMDLRSQILNASFDFDPDYWSNVSDEAKDLVKNMLVVDPNERITLKQALNHPWLDHEATKVDLVALMQREAGFVPNDLASYAILQPDYLPPNSNNGDFISSAENMMC